MTKRSKTERPSLFVTTQIDQASSDDLFYKLKKKEKRERIKLIKRGFLY